MNMGCGKRPRFEVEFEMLQGFHYILLTLFSLGQIEAFFVVYVFTLRMIDWKTSINPLLLGSLSIPNFPHHPLPSFYGI